MIEREEHRMEWIEERRRHDGTVSEGPAGTLSWYRCGDQTYMCGIQGRAMK